MFLSQVFDGLLLPIILVFVMLLAGNRELVGPLVSGRLLSIAGWAVTIAVGILSVALVASQVLGVGESMSVLVFAFAGAASLATSAVSSRTSSALLNGLVCRKPRLGCSVHADWLGGAARGDHSLRRRTSTTYSATNTQMNTATNAPSGIPVEPLSHAPTRS